MTIALSNLPVLETERLILRAPRASDFPALAPFILSDRSKYVGGGADKDETHAWRVLAILTGHWPLRGFGTFVLEDRKTGAPIGSAGPWYPAGWPERELGWTIWTEEAEGKGFAYEAVLELRRHTYADLGWTTAVSYIDPKNTRSIALAERLGCTLDPDAAGPDPDEPLLVYRHPSPEALA